MGYVRKLTYASGAQQAHDVVSVTLGDDIAFVPTDKNSGAKMLPLVVTLSPSVPATQEEEFVRP